MKESPDNPPENRLPSGIKEAALISAIETSGYPLQGIVAAKLGREFKTIEEWSYIDRDTQEHRSLDVFAHRQLRSDANASVQPKVTLLIECKRTVHPYVFFQVVSDRPIPRFPTVAGISDGLIPIYERGGGKMALSPPGFVLGLHELDYVEPGPPKCSAFVKAQAKGDKVHLSGEDSYNGVILPLVKAHDYARQVDAPAGRNAVQIFPTLLLCICVLDAPMLLVESPDQADEPVLSPWIRVVRLEANVPNSRLPPVYYAIDIIHIAAFDEIVEKHLMPFTEAFARRTEMTSRTLISGGVVTDLDSWRWDEVEPKEKH